MTCAQGNCTNPATVFVQVSVSNIKGEPCEPVVVMMCEECAFPFSSSDVLGAGMMGEK